MTYTVEWSKKALKTLARIDRLTSERIVRAMERLATTGHGDVKTLAATRSLDSVSAIGA